MIIAIDLSLRSTGICAFQEGKLIDFAIIASATGNEKTKTHLPVFNGEGLLIYNAERIKWFINRQDKYALDGVVIEGLSFGGLSGNKDILQGNFWHIRCELFLECGQYNVPIGIVPVTSWRSKTINKMEREEALEKYGKKTYLKQGVYDKLPEEIKMRFQEYVTKNKLKKDAVYDLSDAYFLGKYRDKMDENITD